MGVKITNLLDLSTLDISIKAKHFCLICKHYLISEHTKLISVKGLKGRTDGYNPQAIFQGQLVITKCH